MSLSLIASATSALWKREIIKFVRDRSRLVGALVQPLGFWLLLGLGFHGTFRMPEGANASVGYMEFLYPGIIALIVLFTAIFSTISIITEKQEGFLQGALVAPAPRTALVLGNVLGSTTLALGEASLFLLLAPVVGFTLTPAGVLVVLTAGFLLGITFTALGFIIAWRKDTIRGFHAIMNLFLMPLWFLSGSFFPLEGAPLLLRWIMQANPVTYGVAAIRQGLYGLPITGDGLPLALSLGISLFFAVGLVLLAVGTARKLKANS